MSAQHTPGRLLVLPLDAPKGTLMIAPDHDDTGLIAVMEHSKTRMPDHAQAKGNARRLVAAWNACEGIDTKVLEDFPLGVINAEHARVMIERTRQRDELHAALTMLDTWVKAEVVHYDANTPDNFIQDAIDGALKGGAP